MTVTRWATVRFRVPGFHCWPDAPEARAYLRDRHRHLFHFEVDVELNHDERDIEFHDLLDDCKGFVGTGGDYGNWSCETMAARLGGYLLNAPKYAGRELAVHVFEDGEVGATLRFAQ